VSPSLVLIPGLLCDQRLWHEQAATLKKHTNVTFAGVTGHSTIAEMGAAVLAQSLAQSPEHFSVGASLLAAKWRLRSCVPAPRRSNGWHC
jgi:hypothetical protein